MTNSHNHKDKFCQSTHDEQSHSKVEEVPRDDGEEYGAGDGERLQEEVRDEDSSEDLQKDWEYFY